MGSMPAFDDAQVLPYHNIEKSTLKLSLTDAYSPKIWAKQTLLWSLANRNDFDRIYEILKQGLSRMLVDIPELTGATGRGSEDPRDLVIEIPNNGSVDFTKGDLSADFKYPDYETWKSQGWPMTDFYESLSPLGTMSQISDGAGFFKARLTLLKGGMSLSLAMNHLIADGSTIAQIERIWSEHTADVSRGIEYRSHRADAPNEEIRKRLSTPLESANEFKDDGWAFFPTEKSQVNLPRNLASKETAQGIVETAKKEHLEKVRVEADAIKWCVFYISPEGLARLKKDATIEGAPWISTIDAVCGLFWARTQHFLQASQHGHKTSMALFPINIRQRLNPPIESQYIGNCVHIVFLECPLSDLEAPDLTGVQAGAQSVRRTISNWDQSKWEAWLSLAATLPPEKSICPNPLCLLSTHNIGFNDLSKIWSNTLDWGEGLGRPDRVRYMVPPNMFANIAPTVRIHPRLADGGLEVVTSCNEKAQAALEGDEVFGKYGKLVVAYS